MIAMQWCKSFKFLSLCLSLSPFISATVSLCLITTDQSNLYCDSVLKLSDLWFAIDSCSNDALCWLYPLYTLSMLSAEWREYKDRRHCVEYMISLSMFRFPFFWHWIIPIFDSKRLHIAARGGNVKIVAILIRNGADEWLRNNEGLTPREMAVQFNQPQVADILQAENVKLLQKLYYLR